MTIAMLWSKRVSIDRSLTKKLHPTPMRAGRCITGAPKFTSQMGLSCYGIIRFNDGRLRCTGGPLRIHPQQLGGIAAEDRDLVVVAERRGGEDMVDGMLLPRNRMVGAEHDLARADLGDEVAQCLGREHQRVIVELVEIFGGLLLEMDVRIAVLRRDEAGVIVTRRIRRQVAAAVRRDDLETGEFVERAFEDQVLERQRRLERIADGVRQPAVAMEARRKLGHALRMDEQRGAEL